MLCEPSAFARVNFELDFIMFCSHRRFIGSGSLPTYPFCLHRFVIISLTWASTVLAAREANPFAGHRRSCGTDFEPLRIVKLTISCTSSS